MLLMEKQTMNRRKKRHLPPVLLGGLMGMIMTAGGPVQAATVSGKSQKEQALVFTNSSDSLQIQWTLTPYKNGDETGGSDKPLASISVTSPSPVDGVAARIDPAAATLHGNHEYIVTATDYPDRSITMKFPDSQGDWVGDWYETEAYPVNGGSVASLGLQLVQEQTLYEGHYPLSLEVGTWNE